MAAKNLVYVEEDGLKALQRAQQQLQKSAQSRELTAMLNKRIRTAAEPIKTDMKNTAEKITFTSTSRAGATRSKRNRTQNKKSGKWKNAKGLRQEMSTGIKIRIDKGANSAGVRILEANASTEVNRLARAINSKGRIRHPLFGDKNHWYMTKTSNGQGWFDNAGRSHLPKVTADIKAVVVDFTNEIARKIK